jgi:hypothetical protein
MYDCTYLEIATLDRAFNVLQRYRVVDEVSGDNFVHGEDARLHVSKSGGVFISLNGRYTPLWTWTLAPLLFSEASSLTPFVLGAPSAQLRDARNLLVPEIGANAEIICWPEEVLSVVSKPNENGTCGEPRHPLVGQNVALHGNYVVDLRDHGYYLVIAHEHLGSRGATFYGNQYVHVFVLYDRTHPHKLLRRSPHFCFPSSAGSADCEVIQFVGSAVQDGEELIVAYGVNDCESKVATMSLASVLEFAGLPKSDAVGSS